MTFKVMRLFDVNLGYSGLKPGTTALKKERGMLV